MMLSRDSAFVPPKAIIFDLDGTLLDSFAIHFESYRKACAHFGVFITKAEFIAAYGPHANETYNALGVRPHQRLLLDGLRHFYAEERQASLFPGVMDALLKMRHASRLAVVTAGSKGRVLRDIENTGIAPLLDAVVTAADVQNQKPSPEGLLRVLDDLKLSVQAAVYVGDCVTDYDMAKAAGIDFVGVRSEFNAIPIEHPRFNVSSVAELSSLFTSSSQHGNDGLNKMGLEYSISTPPEQFVIPEIQHPKCTADRWASHVLKVCRAERDPKTLSIWAREIGLSYTGLCESCRLIGVQPRNARDFARILRIILGPYFNVDELGSLLDISDKRTLDSILQNAGFRHKMNISSDRVVEFFLDHQQFIPHSNAGLRTIHGVFAAHGLLESESSCATRSMSSSSMCQMTPCKSVAGSGKLPPQGISKQSGFISISDRKR